MVILWLFGSISQSLITFTHSNQANARKVWLNILSILYDDQEATPIQYETKLKNIQTGDLNVHTYYDKVKSLLTFLKVLGKKSMIGTLSHMPSSVFP